LIAEQDNNWEVYVEEILSTTYICYLAYWNVAGRMW